MSILSTDNKLISFGTDYSAGSGISIIDHTISVIPSAVGKTYSAGPNVSIYDEEGQPTISSKDWTQDIDQASSGAVIESTSIFNDWVNGQYTGDITTITNNITALSGDLSSYYKKTETSSNAEISAALDYVSAHAVGDVEVNTYVHNNSATIDEVNSAYQSNSATWNETSNVVSSNSAQWSQGRTYEGVSPIVVNNYENKVSADTWVLSAGDGISFVENSASKVTRIDCTATGDAGVNSFVISNSASILDVNSSYSTNSGTFLTAHQSLDGYATVEDVESSTSGLFPSSAVTPLVNNIFSNTVYYANKPSTGAIAAYSNTLSNVGQIVNQSGLYIIPSSVLQVPNIITVNTGYLNTPLLTADYRGLVLSSQAVNFSSNSNGLTNSASDSYFSAGYYGLYNSGNYTTFSAANAGLALSSKSTYFSAGRYGIYNLVDGNASLFISGGAGKIDINLTGGSAVDGYGNKMWQIGEADHLWSFSNGNPSYTGQPIVLCYAPQAGSARAPYFKAGPGGFTSEYIQNNNTTGLYGDFSQGLRYTNTTNKVTATLYGGDVSYTKYNNTISANEIWSLTGSVQKREIEYDADTSAITAIAGSAIGGGGVTGEFVPQSAFDELKASYDALSASYVTLSSLFATYSGQWLLPNEGV